MEYLKCNCGSTTFHKGTDGRFLMCSKCHNIYDEHGKEMQLKTIIDKGTVVFLKMEQGVQ